MKKVILVIVLFYSIFISFGQVGWQQIFPTSKKANTFNLTLKNNFILAGSKSIPMLMEWDIFQTDSMGNIEWDTIFQRPGFGFPVCVEPTADSGYIIMGFEEPAVYFLKFNKNNSFEWESSINVNYGDITEIRSMVLAKNNNYIAIGDIETPDKGVFLLKIDNNGDTLWTKTHLRNTDSRGISIVPAIDSGYCCLARTSYLKTTLMKLNENGDTLWTKMIDSTFESSSMIATNDSCLLIAGHKGYNKIVYCKIDNYGNKLWTKEYKSQLFYNNCMSIANTFDNGFISANRTLSINANEVKLWIMKLNQNGDSIFSFIEPDLYPEKIIQTSDSLYVFLANNANSHAKLIKTDSTGDVITFIDQLKTSIHKNITCFPNPFNDELKINCSDLKNEIVNLRIYNSIGELIKNKNIKVGKQLSINTTSLNSGVYFIELISDKEIYSAKLIKVDK